MGFILKSYYLGTVQFTRVVMSKIFGLFYFIAYVMQSRLNNVGLVICTLLASFLEKDFIQEMTIIYVIKKKLEIRVLLS